MMWMCRIARRQAQAGKVLAPRLEAIGPDKDAYVLGFLILDQIVDGGIFAPGLCIAATACDARVASRVATL